MDVNGFVGHQACDGEVGQADAADGAPALVDPYGRTIRYLRLSVTDRCDLRCRYCMPARPEFLPKREILTIEELHSVARAFIARGVDKIRITGGEPLVRKGVMELMHRLGGERARGLRELVLTTNGQLLARHAADLYAAGVRRINVSLDTLKAERYREITRGGDLAPVLEGLAQASRAGLSVKLNVVAMRGVNEDEIDDLIVFAGERGFDLTLIETMPLGAPEGGARAEHFLPLDVLRRRLEARWSLVDLPDYATGGPARYARIEETGGRLGFISPLSQNFC
ncbi:MAG: GTP 3',8-cyclase MoaA, partial [Alphaproteobacteria bacterium]